jgi:unsaturated rhamnogalacturonyl hydrolase
MFTSMLRRITNSRAAILRATILSMTVCQTALAQRPSSAAAVQAPKASAWSVRMTDALIARNPQVSTKWDYTAGLVLLAVERVANATGNADYTSYVRRNMDHFVDASGAIVGYKRDEFNLDQINQGRLLFPLLARTHDVRYRTAIETLRAQLRTQPRTSEGGFWHKQIYPQQMWLDGLYMAEPFYVTYAKTFGDTAAFTDALHQFLLLASRARDVRTGLMYHAWDATRAQPWADSLTGTSPNFWGRAVGWYLMAAMDALDEVPASHPDRAALLNVVRELGAAVARVQDPVSGLWYQVLDQPGRAGNYREASASGMFVYAFAKGARRGWLDGRYRELAERGFAGMVRDLITTDAAGRPSLTGVCQVAGLGGTARRDGTFAYYVSEPVVADDYKGVGPFIMAALELGK